MTDRITPQQTHLRRQTVLVIEDRPQTASRVKTALRQEGRQVLICQSTRELVAVLASGQSLYRVGKPILIVAALFSSLQILNQELIVPRIAPLVSRDHNQAGQRDMAATQVPLASDSRGNRLYAASFDPEQARLTDVTVWLFDERGANPDARLSATEATWDGAAWVPR